MLTAGCGTLLTRPTAGPVAVIVPGARVFAWRRCLQDRVCGIPPGAHPQRLRECALSRRAARPTLSDRCGSNVGQSARAGPDIGVDRKQASAAGELVLRLPLTHIGRGHSARETQTRLRKCRCDPAPIDAQGATLLFPEMRHASGETLTCVRCGR